MCDFFFQGLIILISLLVQATFKLTLVVQYLFKGLRKLTMYSTTSIVPTTLAKGKFLFG